MEVKAPFEKLLNMKILEVRKDLTRIMMPYRVEFTNPGGIIHGGAISALADTSGATALGTEYSNGKYYTVRFDIKFKAQAKSDLVAKATLTARKLNVYIYQVEVRDAENKVVALASARYLVSRDTGRPSLEGQKRDT